MNLRALPLMPEPVCLERDASLVEALQLMLERGVEQLPVCDDGVWKGLVALDAILDTLLAHNAQTLPDLRLAADPMSQVASHLEAFSGVNVGHLARRDVPALDEDTPLLEAALLLHRHGRPLPVLGADGRLKGMLSRHALLSHPVTHARH